ncbi:MAG TPA: hypothetical protein V6D03_13880 [Candidatus Caenarcaniphilales bacterium]
MTHSSAFELSHLDQDAQLFWPQLKQAIATSSGFKRWQLEHGLENHTTEHPLDSLDSLVQAYLRQTLETLAY